VEVEARVEVEVAANVEASRELDRVPPPPRSKRKHTDQGWPPAPALALEVALSLTAAADVDPKGLEAPPAVPPILAEPAPSAVVETPPQPVANDVALAPTFDGVDDDIELPFRQSSRRTLWLVALGVLIALVAVVSAVAR
jgi:hypothetical protein